MLNSVKARAKKGKVDRIMNMQIIFIFFVQVNSLFIPKSFKIIIILVSSMSFRFSFRSNLVLPEEGFILF